MIMSPKQLKKLGDKFGTDPVCVGPFKFVEPHRRQTRSCSSKAPDYYDAAKVKLDRLVYKIITDAERAAPRTCAPATSTSPSGSTPTDAADAQEATRSCRRCAVALARLPGHHRQRRQQQRAQASRRQDRHAARDARPSCARRSSCASTARRSTRSSTTGVRAGLRPDPAGQPVPRRESSSARPRPRQGASSSSRSPA